MDLNETSSSRNGSCGRSRKDDTDYQTVSANRVNASIVNKFPESLR